MVDTESLRGRRVTLRHMVRADVDVMANWPPFREPELQWANLELTYPSERDVYFDRGRTNETRRRFVIVDEAGEIIGTVGLRNVDLRAREATLGIIIRADVVGKGYGTDTVETVLAYAFDVLDLDRVLLDVAESNQRARRVYDKTGFRPIGQHLGPQNVTYVDMAIGRAEYLRRYRAAGARRRASRLSG
jgi:RimJ/RimL family protein N-acetyltransferase